MRQRDRKCASRQGTKLRDLRSQLCLPSLRPKRAACRRAGSRRLPHEREGASPGARVTSAGYQTRRAAALARAGERGYVEATNAGHAQVGWARRSRRVPVFRDLTRPRGGSPRRLPTRSVTSRARCRQSTKLPTWNHVPRHDHGRARLRTAAARAVASMLSTTHTTATGTSTAASNSPASQRRASVRSAGERRRTQRHRARRGGTAAAGDAR